VKEQRLDRSTVLRFQLNGKPQQQYGIQRAELVSQYTYKNLRSEAGEYGAAMQSIVACELIYRGVQQKQGSQPHRQQSSSSSSTTQGGETLLYDNEWSVDEKRFYMFGEREFSGNAPFSDVQGKVEKIKQLVQKLIKASSNKVQGIESFMATQQQDLIELLRMCSEPELAQLKQALEITDSRHFTREQQKVNDILADALAAAGTMNTINALMKMIYGDQIGQKKASQTLKNLIGLPAPSYQQVLWVFAILRNF